jgi:RND family efflux transporter MFP subunit
MASILTDTMIEHTGGARARWLGVFATSLLLLALVSGCKNQSKTYEPPVAPAVVALIVEASDAPALVRKGTVEAGARFRLGFQVPGVVETVCCRTGDKVRQGQVLATLRAGDADARLRAANASRSIAVRDEATTAHLADGGALAPNMAKHARDQLAIAEAQAVLASEALRYTRLQSPVSGTVQKRYSEPGEAIAPGAPVLLVEQVGKLVVRVGVLQEELPAVAPGATVALEVDTGGAALTGVIANVAPVPEVADGLFTVEINPKLPPGVKLVPGAIVSVTFKNPVQARAVKIPNDALVTRNGANGVLVLQGPDGAAVANFRPITISKRLGRDVWVSAGLESGERIIREGAYFIEDGEQVRVLAKDAGTHG